MSASPSSLRTRAVQIVAQNDGGGDVVERRLPIGSLALVATAMRRRSSFIRHHGLLGLPRAQPLIHHFDGNTQRFFDTRVYLDLHVRVKSEWREDESVLNDIGLK